MVARGRIAASVEPVRTLQRRLMAPILANFPVLRVERCERSRQISSDSRTDATFMSEQEGRWKDSSSIISRHCSQTQTHRSSFVSAAGASTTSKINDHAKVTYIKDETAMTVSSHHMATVNLINSVVRRLAGPGRPADQLITVTASVVDRDHVITRRTASHSCHWSTFITFLRPTVHLPRSSVQT